MPLASAQASSGWHVMWKWHHLASTVIIMATKTENEKVIHSGARRGSGDHLTPKGITMQCQFERKSTEGGLHCVTDCRQVMTIL